MKLTHKHTLAASYLGYITQAVVNNLTPLLFVVFETSLGISIGRISLLITVNFGVQMLVDLLSAKWINVIGTRRSIVAAHAFAAAGLVALGVLPYRTADPYVGVLCAVCLCAVGGGITEVLISPIVEALPSEDKAGSMSLLHAFYCWGHVGVVVLSTLYFALAGTGRWALLPVLWAVLPLCNMVLFARVPLCTLAGDEHHTPLRALLKSKMIWLFLLMMVCAGASEQGMSQWASLFAETGLKVPKAMGDLLGPCAFAVMMGLSRTLYGIWGARISLKRCMAASCLLCVAGYAAAVFAPWPLLSLAGCALCGFSVGILWPGTFSLSMVHCPEGGTAMFALFALAGDVGCALGPGVVGAVSGMAGGALKAGLLAACAFPVLLQNRVKADWRGYTLPGGHVEKGESFVQAVTREMREETGLTVHAPRLCGIKQFQTDADERYIVLLFKTDRFSGTLRSSEEGEMVWVERDALDAYPLVEDFRELLSVFDRDDLTEFQYERAPGTSADWRVRLY